VNKPHSFALSLDADWGPAIRGLNLELTSHGADTVRKEERFQVDRMLRDALETAAPAPPRCPNCGGYMGGDMDGEPICLNCARPVAAPRHLSDVIQKVAQDLIEYRAGQSSTTSTQAP
jgi:hypothetical protein